MTNSTHASSGEGAIAIRFWGTRGGIPVPGSQTQRYGGETSCIELRCGPHLLILDAGSGLRPLGDALSAAGSVTADVLLSHTHLDHILGIAFFRPLFKPDTVIRFHAGHLPQDDLRRTIFAALTPPLAPDLLAAARARLDVDAFAAGQELSLHPGLVVETAPLHHPGGATGYRIGWNGHTIAYITDTEHDPSRADPNVLGLIRDADVMIYDASYTGEEFPSRIGWGHSTWEEGVRLAEAARVKKLVLFHHDSARTDEDLDVIAAAAAKRREGTIAAFDGLVLTL